MLQGKPQDKLVVQIVVEDQGEARVLAGLSGLLKTATQENRHLKGQLILTPAETTTEELLRYLQKEKAGVESLIRYRQGRREVLRWQERGAAEGRRGRTVGTEQGVYWMA